MDPKDIRKQYKIKLVNINNWIKNYDKYKEYAKKNKLNLKKRTIRYCNNNKSYLNKYK